MGMDRLPNSKMVVKLLLWLFATLCISNGFSEVEGINTPIVIAETKGVQIKLSESKISLGNLQVKFEVNLPSMDFKLNINQSVCPAHIPENSMRACQTLTRIDMMSEKLLLELQTIFTRTDDLTDLNSKRTKRSLLPILGEGFGWLFGMTTDRELNRAIKATNTLGQNLKELSDSHQNLITASQQNFETLKKHQIELEQNLKYFSGVYNSLVKEIGQQGNTFDVVVLKMVSTQTLFNKINILQSHLLALRSIYDKCQDNLLPKIVVDPDTLRAALSKEQGVLEGHAMQLAFNLENVAEYYRLKTVSCKLINKSKLEISLDVPLKDARAEWRVMSIEPVKFLLGGQTCQIVKDRVLIATNGIEIRDLTDVPKVGGLDVYVLPRHNSQSSLSTCIQRLLKQADVTDIANACDLHCADTFYSSVQLLSKTKYSILNPGSTIAVICGNNFLKNIDPLINGRVEIVVPCHCTVQETSGSQLTLVSALRTCNLNLNVNNTVSINMDWASEGFEPYQLFITERTYEKYKVQNVTNNALSLIKLEKFNGKNISNWKNIPITSSGWVEICLWFTIITCLCGIVYCYVKFRFPWINFNSCVNKSPEIKSCPHDESSTNKREGKTPVPARRFGSVFSIQSA
ncbi:uncharacterized protein LOC127750281 [Frankliniella occidentalis]|uniref:Uncharacterized protein LOC127750281 n=1 Tax=Frankliniella occidentalis TaxID=133901 RepID=A0A9C6X1I8_FRAOC|nr:uncharacterized protein LOC127750281 [Frankliniella occidentalis]